MFKRRDKLIKVCLHEMDILQKEQKNNLSMLGCVESEMGYGGGMDGLRILYKSSEHFFWLKLSLRNIFKRNTNASLWVKVDVI